jgi:hypothetical protein
MNDMSDDIDDWRLSRFLLGDVSEAKRTAIEERFLADETLFRHLLLIEDELREAYATGAMTSADRRRFEERFLVFDDEREKVAAVRALATELSSLGASTAVDTRATVSRGVPWHEALRTAFGSLGLPLRLSLAGATAVVLGVLGWQVADGMRVRSELARVAREAAAREQVVAEAVRDQRTRADELAREVEEERRTRAELEQELARRPEPSPGAVDAPPRMVLSLLLLPGRTRAGGDTRTLSVPATAAEVRLQLEVAKPAASHYEAVVLDADGNEVLRRADLRAAGQLVTLTVPARSLVEGDYEVTLTAAPASGDRQRAGDYYFRVLRP